MQSKAESLIVGLILFRCRRCPFYKTGFTDTRAVFKSEIHSSG